MVGKSCSTDLAGLSLDALSAQEEHAARRHVAVCSTCDRTYSEFAEIAAALGTAVDQVAPPEHVKRDVLERTRRSSKCNSPEWRIIIHAANSD